MAGRVEQASYDVRVEARKGGSSALAIRRALSQAAPPVAALVCSGVLVQPLVTFRWMGGGDFLFYLNTTRDFVVQARHGTFPAVVGQTPFLYNGMPQLQVTFGLYLCALLDLLSLHRLSAFALLDLSIATALLGGVLSMYVCLAATGVGRWLAVAAAVLYVSSPAVLSPAYSMDMFPTVYTVPFVPLLVYAAVRFVRRADWTACVLAAAAMTLILVSHAMIALWLLLPTGLIVVVAIAARHRRLMVGVRLVLGLGLFAALAGWYLVPIQELNLSDADQYQFHQGFNEAVFYRPEVYRWTVEHWMWPLGQLKPVPDPPAAKSVQLGYTVWLVALVGAAMAVRRKAHFELRLLAGAIVLLVILLFPIPVLSYAVYRILPKIYELAVTPELRLYIPLAAFALFAGALGLSSLTLPRHTWLRMALIAVGVAGVGWHFHEADKFLHYARGRLLPPAAVNAVLAPENATLSPYSVGPRTGYIGPDGYTYSQHEVFDPAIDNALVAIRSGAAITNAAALKASQNWEPSLPMSYGPRVSNGVFAFRDQSARDWPQVLTFTLQPGTRYFLSYDLHMTNSKGTLEVLGDSLYREVNLSELAQPDEPRLTPRDWDYLSLWTSAPGPETLSLRVYFACGEAASTCGGTLGPFHLNTYTPDSMAVDVLSDDPYRARVRAAAPGFLESQRMFLLGYVSTVNGKRVEVERSARGRAMVPIQAGVNEVSLDYVGTAGTVASRWVSAAAWLGTLLYGIAAAMRSVRGMLSRRR